MKPISDDLARVGLLPAVVAAVTAASCGGGGGGGEATPPALGVTTIATTNSQGFQADNVSFAPTFSEDGALLAVETFASNLVGDVDNGVGHVVVLGVDDGSVLRASVSSQGVQGNDASLGPDLAGDGSCVVYTSFATNLVFGDTNDVGDVFVHDLDTRATERISVSTDGEQANGASVGGVTDRSGDLVGFLSDATNLVPGDTNGTRDAFLRRRSLGTTDRVGLGEGGVEPNDFLSEATLSAEGGFVVFATAATNLTAVGALVTEKQLYRRDLSSGEVLLVSGSPDGQPGNGPSSGASVSADGRFIAFESEATNLLVEPSGSGRRIYLHDALTGETVRVSGQPAGVSQDGICGNAEVSLDGRFVAFDSSSTQLIDGLDDLNGRRDIFRFDRSSGVTQLLTVTESGEQGNGNARNPAISGAGSRVAYEFSGTNLLPGLTVGQVLLHTFADFAPKSAIGAPTPADGAGESVPVSLREIAVQHDGRAPEPVAFTRSVPVPPSGRGTWHATAEPTVPWLRFAPESSGAAWTRMWIELAPLGLVSGAHEARILIRESGRGLAEAPFAELVVRVHVTDSATTDGPH